MPDPENTGLNAGWHEHFPDLDCSTIVVPFPVESVASTISDTDPANVIWYCRNFECPADWTQRICLRIGAADHFTQVFINGDEVGSHRADGLARTAA